VTDHLPLWWQAQRRRVEQYRRTTCDRQSRSRVVIRGGYGPSFQRSVGCIEHAQSSRPHQTAPQLDPLRKRTDVCFRPSKRFSAALRQFLANVACRKTSHNNVRILRLACPVIPSGDIPGFIFGNEFIDPLLRKSQHPADLQQQTEKEVHKIIEALENEASVAGARVNSLRSSLDRFQRRMGQINQDEVKLRALQRDADTNRALLESFLLRYQQANARAEADGSAANARIVSRAQQPTEPSFPRTQSAITFASFAGLIFAFCIAFLLEVFQRGFRTGEQIERATGMPFLGLLPEAETRASRSQAAGELLRDPSGIYAQAIRTLQGHVLLARVGERRAQKVLVTSAIPGEGKTTTAVSLTRALAMGGYRTIIVDADLHASAVQDALGVNRQPGLADMLMGRAGFHHVIRKDPLTQAHVIQAGTNVPNPTAALASSQMQWVLTALQQTYDYVIIDSPAALATADAQVLAKLADVTVLTVKWGETDRKLVARALKLLSAASSRRVGILLTQVNLKRYSRYAAEPIEAYGTQAPRRIAAAR